MINTPRIHTVKASYYCCQFAGRKTADGEIFNPRRYTAAHRTLPFGTVLVVKNPATHHEILVRINDRGPFVKKFGLDLSLGAARALGITKKQGYATVQYMVLTLGDNKYQTNPHSND